MKFRMEIDVPGKLRDEEVVKKVVETLHKHADDIKSLARVGVSGSFGDTEMSYSYEGEEDLSEEDKILQDVYMIVTKRGYGFVKIGGEGGGITAMVDMSDEGERAGNVQDKDWKTIINAPIVEIIPD